MNAISGILLMTISNELLCRMAKVSLSMVLVAFASTSALGAQVAQYASTVLGYSSTSAQWAWERGDPTDTGYTAEQALARPTSLPTGRIKRLGTSIPWTAR